MTRITAFNRLLTSGERSGSHPELPGLFQALKETPGPSELAKDMKPRTHKEKIERLIELIAEKKTPRLKGRIKVEITKVGNLNYKVRRNGTAILIQLSTLPNDKRFPEILMRFSIAARRLISAQPFDIPAPRMTPEESRGWVGLKEMGARISRGGTALDLRSILPHDTASMARFLHLWQLVRSGPTNVPIKNRDGDPIGVYTKERLS